MKNFRLSASLVLLLAIGLTSWLACENAAQAGEQDIEKLNRFVQSASSSDAEMALFRQGRDFIEAEEWGDAIEKFREYIKTWSDGKNVDAAYYWLAFSLKKIEKFQEANDQLTRLISNFPKSRWRDDAGRMQVEIARALNKEPPIAQGGDEEMKLYALQSLCQGSTERCISAVNEILKPGSNASPRLKENAVSLLGQHGGKEGAALLVNIARNETNPRIRKQAIFWMGQTDSEEVLGLLKDLATQSPGDENEAAKAAVFALAQHASPQAGRILSELARSAQSTRVRKEAIFWLGQRGGDSAVDELVTIYDANQDADIRKQVLFSLSQHASPRARAKLVEVARSGAEPEVRKQAIFWLGQKGDEQSADELLKIYEADTGGEVRKNIIFSLSQMNNQRAKDKLFEIARSGADEKERAEAIFWIGQQGGPQVCENLSQLYDNDKSEEVKKKIIFSLGQAGGKCGLRKLMDIAKKDSSVELRKQAIFWLGQSDDPEAAKFLEEIIK